MWFQSGFYYPGRRVIGKPAAPTRELPIAFGTPVRFPPDFVQPAPIPRLPLTPGVHNHGGLHYQSDRNRVPGLEDEPEGGAEEEQFGCEGVGNGESAGDE